MADEDDGVPEDIQIQYKAVREDMLKMNKAIEDAESAGDDSGNDFKRMLLREMCEKVKELEDKNPGLLPGYVPPKKAKPKEEAKAVPVTPALSLHEGLRQMLAVQQRPREPLTLTQQQALQYDLQKQNSTTVEPEVLEFCAHFGMNERHARMLNDQLRARKDTFEEDLNSLYRILSRCNNPAQKSDLLTMNCRWMKECCFKGEFGPNIDVREVAERLNLDPPAACKLAEALETREDPEADFKLILARLERSHHPSSMAMKLLKDVKAGNAIEEPTQAPSAGSWLHKEELRKAQQRDDDKRADRRGGRRERSSSAKQRYTSRSRGGGRREPPPRAAQPSGGRPRSRSGGQTKGSYQKSQW